MPYPNPARECPSGRASVRQWPKWPICGMQIPRFTASKPSKFAFASDEKSIRQPTTSFVRCYPNHKTSDKIQETWVCSPKGWRGRAESPLLASAEAKPSATSKALPHNSSAALAMPFLPSASCRNLDLPPVNLRFLQSHLTKNAFAIAPTHLCGIAQNSSLEKKINQNITPQT